MNAPAPTGAISARGPQRTRSVEIAGHRAVLTEMGDGPRVMLLLPSLFARSRSYRSTARAVLAAVQNVRVVRVELPGSGRGSRLASPWSLAQYARWLAALLEAEDLSPHTLVAHSNSGPIALMLAARAPHRVQRIVLADSVGADCVDRSVLSIIAARALDAIVEWRLTLCCWHHVAYNLVRHARSFVRQIRLATEADVSAVARHVRAPVLIAWGRRDRTMPLRCAQRLYEMLPPGSRVYVSPLGSHDWLVARPREFADVVAAFARGEEVATPIDQPIVSRRQRRRRSRRQSARRHRATDRADEGADVGPEAAHPGRSPRPEIKLGDEYVPDEQRNAAKWR